ncbi:MAG: TonB-dependent receptor [Alphaproteobacteria bacterium]|nr:TonB-dependent receptor [Alphaproteobacteria bacterium]
MTKYIQPLIAQPFRTMCMFGLAVLLIGGGASSAFAQLDEIIVTAERRESNLQDVPVAVTALGAEEIERTDIHDPYTLQFKVPNFTFNHFSAGQNIFSLRGISSNDDGAGTDNSVAVFLDDVYFGRISNSAFDFFDVERVEVLRGPQGTLWGKNAIGGTVNIVSKRPSMDGLEVKGKMDVGDYNLQNYGGYVTGPLSPTLAAKFAFSVRNRDGFLDNVLDLNPHRSSKLLDDDSSSYRTQFLWEPSDRTSFLLTLASQRTDENDMGRIPIPNQNPALTSPRQGPATRAAFVADGGNEKDLKAASPQPGFAESESDSYSLKLVQELGAGELTYIAATYETDTHWEMDSVGASVLAIIDDIRDSTEATSHELRYAMSFGDNIDLIVGAYYLEEDTDRSEYFRLVFGDDDRRARAGAREPTITAEGVRLLDGVDVYRQINETESKAVFANVDWQFMPDWRVSAGVRWTEDDKNIRSFARNGFDNFIINGNLGDVENATGGAPGSGNWDDVSPKVALNWQPMDDMLLYASWAKGFKSGGFGAAPATVEDARNLALDPEEATNIEIGIKTDLLNNTLRINLAAFQTDYEDLQYQRFGQLLALRTRDPVTGKIAGASLAGFESFGDYGVRIDPNSVFGFFRSINAGDAEMEGIEVEITYAPTEALTLYANYGYLDSEQEINFREYFATDPGMDVILKRPLRHAPETTYSFGFVYNHDMGQAGSLILSSDYTYSDESRADVVDDYAIQDKHELIDANLVWVPVDANWRFSLWGKNIADERFFSNVYTVGRGVIGRLGDPRVLGASVTWELQ